MHNYVDHSWFKTILKIDIKKILALSLIFFSYQSYAAENPYTTAAATQNRADYAKAMDNAQNRASGYPSTKAMVERSISAASNNGSVTQTGSASATVPDGSKVTGGGSVTKPINAAAVAKATVGRLEKAKALGKATLPGFLGSAAVSALIAGVGWIMDEGGKVTKQPDEDPSYKYCYKTFATCKLTLQAACEATFPNKFAITSGSHPSGIGAFICNYYNTQADADADKNKVGLTVWYSANPSYSSSAPAPVPLSVSNSDLEKAIENHITNNTTNNNITNNIVNNAYSYDSSNGSTSSDATNSLATDAANDIVNEIPKAVNTGSSSTSSGTGATSKTVTATINSDTSANTTSDNTSTTTNPDGSTTTTTGTGTAQMQLRAFCTWASVMCDWYEDWTAFTKDETDTDTEEEVPEIKEIDIGALDTTTFRGTAGCPQPIQVPVNLGSGGNVEISYEPICQFASQWSFVAPLIGFLSGAMIIVGVGRKGEDGEL